MQNKEKEWNNMIDPIIYVTSIVTTLILKNRTRIRILLSNSPNGNLYCNQDLKNKFIFSTNGSNDSKKKEIVLLHNLKIHESIPQRN